MIIRSGPTSDWRPGRDRRAVRHPGRPGDRRADPSMLPVVVAGGGIAGLAAATGLAERGVPVILIEPQRQLGGRVRAWPVDHGGESVTMSRGFHAFFRQYYNLRALLRRADPGLDALVGIDDYPLVLAGGHTDSFAKIPRTPPLNLLAFVAQSPAFGLRDLAAVDVSAAMELLDVEFPATFAAYDGESASGFLDRLRFPDGSPAPRAGGVRPELLRPADGVLGRGAGRDVPQLLPRLRRRPALRRARGRLRHRALGAAGRLPEPVGRRHPHRATGFGDRRRRRCEPSG